MNNFVHVPVLLHEAIDSLNVLPGKKFIDATLGGGGHTKEILASGGLVLGIDQDDDSIEYCTQKLATEIQNGNLKLVNGNFGDIISHAKHNGFDHVDGILLDLGLSSYQLDTSGRGFSFRYDEPLDMRMNKKTGLNAFEVVNKYSRERLIEIFYRYAEEHNSVKIADSIIENRKKDPIQTTKQLASLIEKVPHKSEAIHPATRVFQAIRIEVNDEINELKKGLLEGFGILNSHGRLAVISFHSLEDRVVKKFFDQKQKDRKGIIVTKKPIMASFAETKRNKRARSAKLRVIEKI